MNTPHSFNVLYFRPRRVTNCLSGRRNLLKIILAMILLINVLFYAQCNRTVHESSDTKTQRKTHGITPGIIEATMTTRGPTNATMTTRGPANAAMTTREPTNAAMTTRGPTNAAMTTRGPTNASMTTRGPTNASMTTRGPTNAAMTTREPTNAAMTTRGPTNAAMTTRGPTNAAMTTRGPTNTAMTTRGTTNATITTTGPSSKEPVIKYFIKVKEVEHYMYSAFVNSDSNITRVTDVTNVTSVTNYNLNVVITSLDASNETYECCVVFKDIKDPIVTPARLYFSYTGRTNVYLARQYSCSVPVNSSQSLPQRVTLTTSSSCPSHPNDYVTIEYPTRHHGRIALCGKVVYGGGRDPEEIIEWFEMQRILGVDKVLIYDLGNHDNLTRVFRYYQNLGFLDVQPYELPGKQNNRTFSEKLKYFDQFDEDETMAVLECRQRMGGYDYIISHDLDEIIIPRKYVTLKTLFEEHKTLCPRAAAFFFHTEYFITTWQPTNPEEDLMVKRYRRATLPRWERYKYFYRPPRVLTSIIHQVFPISGDFNIEKISPDVARLHHYRVCPKENWGTCQVDNAVDDIIMRYTDLDERVLKVTKEICKPNEYEV